MATRTNLLTRLRNDSALCGHAMPFGLVKLNIDAIGKISGPIYVFAQGLSMPISRGSPPIP